MIRIAAKAASCIQTACEAARPGTPAARATSDGSGFERVGAGGRTGGWRWNVATMACLTGAVLALGACKKEEHDKNLLAVGAAATGVAQYPNGPKFWALPGKQAEVDFDHAERNSINNVTTMGHVKGRDFTKEELADLYAVLDAVRPLWRCDNTPLDRFARIDKLLEGTKITPHVLGVAFFGKSRLIALADTAHGFGFRIVVVHELGHKLLQHLDPRDCQVYNQPYDNPLVKKWMARMGWKDKKTLDSPFIPGTFVKEQVVRKYALESPLEDMAESLAYYLGDRETLRKLSPSRVAFFDELFKELGAQPTNALHDPPAFKYYVAEVDRKLKVSPSNRIFQLGFKVHGSQQVVTIGLDRDWTPFIQRETID